MRHASYNAFLECAINKRILLILDGPVRRRHRRSLWLLKFLLDHPIGERSSKLELNPDAISGSEKLWSFTGNGYWVW